MPNQTKLELLRFGELLRTDFDPLNITLTLQTQNIEHLKQEINMEALRIINELKNATCRNYEENHLERYIQTHQRESINLMDITGEYIQGLNSVPMEQNFFDQANSLYKTKIEALENILNYIEKEQCKYFDLSLAVPGSYLIRSAGLLNSSLNVLKAKLKSKDIDPDLQKIILDYIIKHCASQSRSYQQLIYAKLIMDSLLNLLSVNKDLDWNEKIIINLIYLNFNTIGFFMYCKENIVTSVAAGLSLAAQAEKFSWYAKEIKNIHLKPNVAYKLYERTISELLLTFIGVELLHLAKIQNPVYEQQQAVKPTEQAEKPDAKLSLNLSVDQLALFIELFMRLKLIPIEKGKIMATIDFFAQNVTTVGTDAISMLSLNKSRKPSPRTAAWMKEILKVMASVLEDMKTE